MRNKYNNCTVNEIVNEIYMNKDINNIDLANKMADILNFSFKCFFEEIAITYDSNITIFYRYKSLIFDKIILLHQAADSIPDYQRPLPFYDRAICLLCCLPPLH